MTQILEHAAHVNLDHLELGRGPGPACWREAGVFNVCGVGYYLNYGYVEYA